MTLAEHSPLRVLMLPRRSQRQQAEPPADIIVLLDRTGWDELGRIMPPARAAVVPVIDASRTLLDLADARVRDADSLAQVVPTVLPLVARVASLPARYFACEDECIWLLARMMTRETTLMPGFSLPPVFDADSPSGLFYGGLPSDASAFAEELAELGLVDRCMVERLRVCPACGASALRLRSVCACHMSNLACACSESQQVLTAYVCVRCAHAGSFEALATEMRHAYRINEAGRRAICSGMDLTAFSPAFRERQLFCASMLQSERQGQSSPYRLLRIRTKVQPELDGAARRQRIRHQIVREALAPFARSYVFDQCIVAQFETSSEELWDSVPHVRDILYEAGIEAQIDVIGPRDVIRMTQTEAVQAGWETDATHLK